MAKFLKRVDVKANTRFLYPPDVNGGYISYKIGPNIGWYISLTGTSWNYSKDSILLFWDSRPTQVEINEVMKNEEDIKAGKIFLEKMIISAHFCDKCIMQGNIIQLCDEHSIIRETF